MYEDTSINGATKKRKRYQESLKKKLKDLKNSLKEFRKAEI